MLQTLTILAPLFVSIAGGFLLGKWRHLPPKPFVQAVMDLFMPVLVFVTLMTQPITLDLAVDAGLSALIVLGFLLVLCIIVGKLQNKPLQDFALPILFMNSGFLGIPLVKIIWGTAALGGIVFYDQIQTLCIFTLGIGIAASGTDDRSSMLQPFVNGLKGFIKEPLVHAILLAFLLLALGVKLPYWVTDPLVFIGDVTPAIALFALGVRLSTVHNFFYKGLFTGLLLRFVGGMLGGLAAVKILNLEGLLIVIVLIASTLPSAVFSYVLAERYNRKPEEAAAFLFISTVLAIPILPLLLLYTQKTYGM